MNTIDFKSCSKCKVDLPPSEYQLKRTGAPYKVCNKCRKVSAIDFSKINEESITNQLNQLKYEITNLKSRINEYELLDGIGNVYLRDRPKNMFTVSELMLQVGVDILFFDLKFKSMMPEDVFKNLKERRGYIVKIARAMAREFKDTHGIRAERTKTYRKVKELMDGLSSTGCLYPPEFSDNVLHFIDKNPPPKIYHHDFKTHTTEVIDAI